VAASLERTIPSVSSSFVSGALTEAIFAAPLASAARPCKCGSFDLPVQRHLLCFDLRCSLTTLLSGARNHVGCHVSRSMRARICPNRRAVKWPSASCRTKYRACRIRRRQSIRLVSDQFWMARGRTRRRREMAEAVRDDPEEQPHLVGPEPIAGEARPMSGFFALLDPLLRRSRVKTMRTFHLSTTAARTRVAARRARPRHGLRCSGARARASAGTGLPWVRDCRPGARTGDLTLR
jgi:hypothetical protein